MRNTFKLRIMNLILHGGYKYISGIANILKDAFSFDTRALAMHSLAMYSFLESKCSIASKLRPFEKMSESLYRSCCLRW
jgi:hypothetical protein